MMAHILFKIYRQNSNTLYLSNGGAPFYSIIPSIRELVVGVWQFELILHKIITTIEKLELKATVNNDGNSHVITNLQTTLPYFITLWWYRL